MKSQSLKAKMRESRIREAAADAQLLMHSPDCTYTDFKPCSCDLRERTQAWRDKYSEIPDHNLDTIRSYAPQGKLDYLVTLWKEHKVVSEKVV